MQLYQQQPSFIKEGLLIFLGGLILLFSIVIALKISVLLGDLICLLGIGLIMYSNYKEYKKSSSTPNPTFVKIGLISGSIGSALFVGFIIIVMFVINIFK